MKWRVIEASAYQHEACDGGIRSNWPIGIRGLCTYMGFPRVCEDARSIEVLSVSISLFTPKHYLTSLPLRSRLVNAQIALVLSYIIEVSAS